MTSFVVSKETTGPKTRSRPRETASVSYYKLLTDSSPWLNTKYITIDSIVSVVVSSYVLALGRWNFYKLTVCKAWLCYTLRNLKKYKTAMSVDPLTICTDSRKRAYNFLSALDRIPTSRKCLSDLKVKPVRVKASTELLPGSPVKKRWRIGCRQHK